MQQAWGEGVRSHLLGAVGWRQWPAPLIQGRLCPSVSGQGEQLSDHGGRGRAHGAGAVGLLSTTGSPVLGTQGTTCRAGLSPGFLPGRLCPSTGQAGQSNEHWIQNQEKICVSATSGKPLSHSEHQSPLLSKMGT